MRTDTTRMHYALRDALQVELAQLLRCVNVLQEYPTAGSGGLTILIRSCAASCFAGYEFGFLCTNKNSKG